MLVKKDTESDLIKKSLQPPGLDFLIQNRSDKLRNTRNNDNNSNSNNNYLSPPPSPPPSFFQPPPPPQPQFLTPQPPLQAPQPPLLPPSSFHLPPPPPLPPTTHLFGSQVMRKEREPIEEKKIIDEIDTAINDIPDPPKLELTDPLLNTLGTEARIF